MNDGCKQILLKVELSVYRAGTCLLEYILSQMLLWKGLTDTQNN